MSAGIHLHPTLHSITLCIYKHQQAAFDSLIKSTSMVVKTTLPWFDLQVFSTYVMEGIANVGRRATSTVYRKCRIKAGMPVGPLALTDEVSLKLMDHIRKQTEKDLTAEGKHCAIPPRISSKRKNALLQIVRVKHWIPDFTTTLKVKSKHLWPELTTLFPLKSNFRNKK